MNEETKLRELLEKVPQSYNDFVNDVLHTAKNENAYSDIIKFIEDTPEAQTDDILGYTLKWCNAPLCSNYKEE